MGAKEKLTGDRAGRISLTGVDYTKLSNEQLHTLLCVLVPDMISLPVTWETRETAIRMLQVTERM